MWNQLRQLNRNDAAKKPYWIWFQGRRTAILADGTSRESAIAAARLKKKRGGDAVETCRLAKPEEYKSGGWFRGGPNGELPGESKLRGQGPPIGGYQTFRSAPPLSSQKSGKSRKGE